MGITSDYYISPYQVYVYYTIPGEMGRGKLMTTQMDTSPKTTTYYFTPKYGMASGYIQYQELYDFSVEKAHFMYAGTTNFI